MKNSFKSVIACVLMLLFQDLVVAQTGDFEDLSDRVSEMGVLGKYSEMKPFCKALCASKQPKHVAKGYHWLGIINDYEDRDIEAIESYYSALTWYKELKDTGHIAMIYGDIGVVYYELRDRKNGKYFMLKSLAEYTKNYHPRFEYDIGVSYFNLANIHISLFGELNERNHLDTAKRYFASAENIFSKMERTDKLKHTLKTLRMNYGILLAMDGDPNYSLFYIDDALPYFKELKDSVAVSSLYNGHAHYFYKVQKYDTALTWCNKAIAGYPMNGSNKRLLDFAGLKMELLRKLGNSEQALVWHDKVTALKGKISSQSVIADIQALRFRKEKKALMEASDQEMSSVADLHGKKMSRAYVVISLILIFLVIGSCWIIFLRKKRKKLFVQLKYAELERKKVRKELEGYKMEAIRYIERMNEGPHIETNPGLTVEMEGSSHDVLLNEISGEIKDKHSLGQLIEKSQNIGLSFLLRIKREYPTLSKGEVRLCVYLLIGMSSKDVARIVNIEPASVDRRRYRLRKKLNLDKNDNLITFLEEIENQALLESVA